MTKILSAYSGSTPMPLSATPNSQKSPSRADVDADHRRDVRAVELQPVAEQVEQQLAQQRRVALHLRQVAD